MIALLIFLAIVLIIGLVAANKPRKPTVLNCPVVQVERDESYVRYGIVCQGENCSAYKKQKMMG